MSVSPSWQEKEGVEAVLAVIFTRQANMIELNQHKPTE